MTEQATTFTLEPFPGAKEHRLAWPMAKRMYKARAMTAVNNTVDRTGLLFYLIEGNEFDKMSYLMRHDEDDEEDESIKVFVPLKRPVFAKYYHGEGEDSWHDSAAYKHDFDIWNKMENALSSYTAKFLASLDEVSLGAIGTDDERLVMPLRDMFHALETRFGCITSGELRVERAKLRTPLLSLAKFDKHLAQQDSVHMLLEDNGVEICENERIFVLQDSLSFFPELETPINNFEREHKLKSELRSLDRFKGELISYIHTNSLTDLPPKNQPHAYAAHMAKRGREEMETPSTTPAQSSQSEERLIRIEKLLANVGKNRTNNKKPTGEDKRPKKAGAGAGTGADPPTHYCFQHGFGNHNGQMCRNFEHADNLKNATADNTMGGSAKVWKPRK